MTPQQQRIAIAEFCGWIEILSSSTNDGMICRLNGEIHCIPDYCNDLNAMHEAESKLCESQQCIMGPILQDIAFRDGPSNRRYIFAWNATAAQRSEALLRAIGRWSDADAEMSAVMKFGWVSE